MGFLGFRFLENWTRESVLFLRFRADEAYKSYREVFPLEQEAPKQMMLFLFVLYNIFYLLIHQDVRTILCEKDPSFLHCYTEHRRGLYRNILKKFLLKGLVRVFRECVHLCITDD